MNIQRKNSAHHFRMQSEREQTLVYLNLGKGSSNLWVRRLKSLGKGSFRQRLLQIIIRLNT